MMRDKILYRPIMFDMVLDELTCFETMNSTPQLIMLCFSVFVSLKLKKV